MEIKITKVLKNDGAEDIKQMKEEQNHLKKTTGYCILKRDCLGGQKWKFRRSLFPVFAEPAMEHRQFAVNIQWRRENVFCSLWTAHTGTVSIMVRVKSTGKLTESDHVTCLKG